MKLTGEMPVPSLSTGIPEQDANVNEYHRYCLDRMKRDQGAHHLPADDNISMDRVACRSQAAVLSII